ncbi:MAG TPA: PilZ domain-containing protein [Polyangia bacterium]|nr:PilZ domain-containing protein [Polyangia bacterium]
MKHSRRVEPRAPYPEDVSLTRAKGGKSIVARGVNISASGIYLHCVEPCEIGSQVVCAVLLDGGPRRLPGHITRLEALPGMIGVAIAFADLSARDMSALRGYVGHHQAAAVAAKLSLTGMPGPVRCEAIYNGDTIRLSTALPFLRLDSEVGVHRDSDPDDATTAGVLSRVALEPSSSDGVPRLALDIDVTRVSASASPSPLPMRPSSPSRAGRPSPVPLPSVVISPTLQTETLAMRAGQATAGQAPRHDTAEVARRWYFKDWSSPPAIMGGGRRARSRRLWRNVRRFFAPLETLTGLPFWASCVFALVFGFVTALILR